MLRDLIKEGGLYTVANLLTKGISLLLIPFYTAYFSPADYGVLDIVNLFVLFVNAVFTLQLNQGLARYVSEPSLKESDKKLYASSAIWFTIIFFSFISVLILWQPYWIIDLLSSKNSTTAVSKSSDYIDPTILRYATVMMMMNTIFYLLGVHLRFLRKVKQYTVTTLIHSTGGIALILFLVLQYKMGIEAFFIAYIIITPPLILVQFILLKKEIVLKFKFDALKKMLSYSIPLIPAAVALLIMNFADRYYIKEYLNFEYTGIYAIAGKFASIFTLIVSGFSMALGPMFFQKHDEERTRTEMSRIFKLYIAIGAIGVLVLSLFSKEVVILVTDSAYHKAHTVMPYMFYAAFFAGIHIFSQGLNIQKKTVIVAFLVIFFAGLNILLNILFIPKYQLYGAAFSTLIAACLYYSIKFVISQKYYPFKVPSLSISLSLFLLFIGIFFYTYLDPELGFLNAFIKISIIVLFSILMFVLKLIDYKEVLLFLQKIKYRK